MIEWKDISTMPETAGAYLVWLEPIDGNGSPSWSVRKQFYYGCGQWDVPESVYLRFTDWMPVPNMSHKPSKSSLPVDFD